MRSESGRHGPAIRWPTLMVNVYAWLAAVAFGLVVLDVIYSRLLLASFTPDQANGIFNEISDFLLFPLGLLVLTGLVALVAGHAAGSAARLVLASWLVIVGSVPLAILLAPLLDAAGLGALVRLALSGLASVLAMLGALRFQAPGALPGPA